MNEELSLKIKLERTFSDLVFKHVHSEVFINYCPEHGPLNWEAHDKAIEGMTRLDIDFVPEKGANPDWFEREDKEVASRIYQNYIQWMFGSLRLSRFFSYVFFRQSEMCFGWLSIVAERLKLMTYFYYVFRDLKPLEEFDPFHILSSELYFQLESNRNQPPDIMVFYCLQQAHFEQSIIALLKILMPVREAEIHKEFTKIHEHYEHQIEFFSTSLLKFWELKPDLKHEFLKRSQPFLNYLESFVETNRLLQSVEESRPGYLQIVREQFVELCKQKQIPVEEKPGVLPKDLRLQPQEQKIYAVASSKHLMGYRDRIMKVIEDHGVKNDALLQDCFRKMSAHQSYKDQFNTGIYEYYMFEQKKIQWQLQDVKEYMGCVTDLSVTDRDFELFDIIKEIGYCEAATYTIGFSNLMHLGTVHPFTLWNTQQCHEELKHFHAVRWVLNHYGVQTTDLDEQYLAVANVEPTGDFFFNQYDTVMINFLGETHNIRAYLMLADSLESQPFKKVMRWIAEDEVVHKKVFGAYFNYMRSLHKNWEQECYESLMDQGLHMHQAKVSPHYYKLMKKIGMFYSKANRTSALKFLNMSMRAQYLELKALFSPDVFTVSEFDFRKKHLAAYAFDP